jgi:hypothetical protein
MTTHSPTRREGGLFVSTVVAIAIAAALLAGGMAAGFAAANFAVDIGGPAEVRPLTQPLTPQDDYGIRHLHGGVLPGETLTWKDDYWTRIMEQRQPPVLGPQDDYGTRH